MLVNFREKKEVLSSISDAKLLEIGLPHMKFYYRNGQYMALCPFHSDSHLGSFGYNPSKRCWRCFVCGESGQGVYSLIMACNNWDFKKTIDYLYENRNMPTPGFANEVPSTLIAHGRKARKPIESIRFISCEAESFSEDAEDTFVYNPNISAEDLSLIYGCFAAASPLKPAEADSLCLKRGLYHSSAKDFFRFPSSNDQVFWNRFRERLAKYDVKTGEERLYHKLLGVPGFFWDLEKSRVGFIGYGNSLGILNHDANKRINGIELRLRTSNKNDPRYMPFSSDGICYKYPDRFTDGTCLGSIVDVVYKAFADKPYLGIAITEGKFKAIHLAYLGYNVLNIHGISNWKKAIPVLQSMTTGDRSPSKVTIVFDSDSRCNPPVAEHSMALGQELMNLGYETEYLTWSAKYGKGIDDMVNAGYRHMLRSAPAARFISTTLAPFIQRAKARREREKAALSAQAKS